MACKFNFREMISPLVGMDRKSYMSIITTKNHDYERSVCMKDCIPKHNRLARFIILWIKNIGLHIHFGFSESTGYPEY